MNLIKQFYTVAFSALFLFASCSKDGSPEAKTDPQIKVTSVEITTSDSDMSKGSTLTLTYSLMPTNATNKAVRWQTSDQSLATVDGNGVVTAIGVGEVTITLQSDENPAISDLITLTIIGNTTNEITSVSVDGKEAFFISDYTIGLQLPEGTDLTNLLPEITHNGGSITPSTDQPQDFSNPVTYTVTSEQGEAQEWVVKIIAVQPPPISTGFITTWNTQNEGLSDSNQITIPINENFVYNYNVDWGDGTSDTGISGSIIHSYEIPGTYSVAITGVFPTIYFNAPFYGADSDRQKIILVNQWGDNQWLDVSSAFKGCTELDVIATDVPDFTYTVRTQSMFSSCKKLVGNEAFANWDVSTILNSAYMFSGCDLFNQDIGNWDVSNMVNLSGLFQACLAFNQDISNWDLSSAEFVLGLFNGATSFNQDIGNWSFPLVTSLGTMFQQATSFNQDISGWDVSNVQYFTAMFNGAEAFNQPIGSWDMSNALDLIAMFQGAEAFTQDITGWDVSNVRDISIMFAYNQTFNQDISGWDVSKVESMGGLFWNNFVFNQDLSAWDFSSVTNMEKMFKGAFSFDQSLASWNVQNVQNMTEMFDSSGLSRANYDATLIAWNNLPALQPNVLFNGGNSVYCDSEAARQNLIDTHGWTIVDGGKDCN